MTSQIILDGTSPRALAANRYVIGRSEECDILLPAQDNSASRRHAVLERDGDGDWCVIDLGSSNGTFVGSERVHDRRKLRDGDQIRIGRSRITLVSPRARTTAQISQEKMPAPEHPFVFPDPDLPTLPLALSPGL